MATPGLGKKEKLSLLFGQSSLEFYLSGQLYKLLLKLRLQAACPAFSNRVGKVTCATQKIYLSQTTGKDFLLALQPVHIAKC